MPLHERHFSQFSETYLRYLNYVKSSSCQNVSSRAGPKCYSRRACNLSSNIVFTHNELNGLSRLQYGVVWSLKRGEGVGGAGWHGSPHCARLDATLVIDRLKGSITSVFSGHYAHQYGDVDFSFDGHLKYNSFILFYFGINLTRWTK